MLLVDLDMLAVRPSILAATSIQFGLSYSQRYSIDHNTYVKDIPADKTKKDVEEEVDSIFKAWRQISSVLLHEIADYSEIVYFTKEIEERLFYIDSKVGKKFTSVFKHKVTHYFPEILDKDRMEELSLKYWNII